MAFVCYRRSVAFVCFRHGVTFICELFKRIKYIRSTTINQINGRSSIYRRTKIIGILILKVISNM